jgi:Protein of unknown function (DUF3014)
MTDPDLPLHDDGEDPSFQTDSGLPIRWMWLAAVALACIAGATAFVILRGGRAKAPVQAPSPVSSTAPQPAITPDLGGQPEPIVVPPLDQSDPVVRQLVQALTRSPRVLAWLATPDLIRTFTRSVTNVADDKSPAQALAVFRPKAPFTITTQDRLEYVNPTSYQRYTTLAAAATSIDPSGAARVYATLKPRINDAYHELGFPQQSFDPVLERAILTLLSTPIVRGPIALRHKGIGYAFEDQRLEQLSAPQKQLLRMGPDNMLEIQNALRAIGLALGISPDRLQANGGRAARP